MGTAEPVVVCDTADRSVAEDQLARIDVVPTAIVCLPTDRSSAPALAAAALLVAEAHADALLLVLPARHTLPSTDVFAADVAAAVPAAEQGHLVAVGVEPGGPRSLDGRPHQGSASAAHDRACISETRWPSDRGVLLLSLRGLLDDIAVHAPVVARATAVSVALAVRRGRTVLLEPESFELATSGSLDDAVTRRTRRAVLCPLPGRDVDGAPATTAGRREGLLSAHYA